MSDAVVEGGDGGRGRRRRRRRRRKGGSMRMGREKKGTDVGAG
jgi:hypothetical protein